MNNKEGDMNTADPHVSIIILNWNGWEDTIECLESVYQITYPNYDIIVADNGSEDESIKKIKKYTEGNLEVTSKFFTFSVENKPIHYIDYSLKEAEAGGGRESEIMDLPSQKKIILIENGKNFGFAEGNNIAIRYSLKALNPEYILLLNNDTVVDRDFLNELITVAESDKKIGFVGPKTYYYDHYGMTDVINFAGGTLVMWRGRTFNIGIKETDKGQYDRVTDVDYVQGSCLLARRETIESIGLLDPCYFLYWEETDWCIRARMGGYRLLYAFGAKIWHKVSVSSNSKSKRYYLTRNKFIFLKRYADRMQSVYFFGFFFGIELWILSFVILFYYRNFQEWVAFIRGMYDGIKYAWITDRVRR